MSCVPNTRFDHKTCCNFVMKVVKVFNSVAQNMNSFINLPLLCTLVEIMVYFRFFQLLN